MHHHQQTPTPSNAATAAGLPFPSYGYAYPRMGYPGVPPQPQPAPAASSPSAKPSPDHDGDSVDAYEAAQTILKAINFGNLLQLPVEESDDSRGADEHQPQHTGLETLLSHVQAALASSTAGTTAAGPLPVAEPAEPAPQTKLTNPGTAVDLRAELQAQLAFLAAQLAELSQTEEAASIVQDAPPLPSVPTFVPTHDAPRQISPVTPAIADLNPSETHNDDDDDDSDDDDMEEII